MYAVDYKTAEQLDLLTDRIIQMIKYNSKKKNYNYLGYLFEQKDAARRRHGRRKKRV